MDHDNKRVRTSAANNNGRTSGNTTAIIIGASLEQKTTNNGDGSNNDNHPPKVSSSSHHCSLLSKALTANTNLVRLTVTQIRHSHTEPWRHQLPPVSSWTGVGIVLRGDDRDNTFVRVLTTASTVRHATFLRVSSLIHPSPASMIGCSVDRIGVSMNLAILKANDDNKRRWEEQQEGPTMISERLPQRGEEVTFVGISLTAPPAAGSGKNSHSNTTFNVIHTGTVSDYFAEENHYMLRMRVDPLPPPNCVGGILLDCSGYVVGMMSS